MQKRDKGIVVLVLGVLILGVILQAEFMKKGIIVNNSNAEGDPWGALFGLNADIQFSNKFMPGMNPKKFERQPRPVDIDRGMEAIPQDPVYASRLSELYAYDSFEGAPQPIWSMEMAEEPYSGMLSEAYAFDGDSSLRIELRRDDPVVNHSKRSELALKFSEKSLASHTYSVAVLLPAGGEEDYAVDPEGSEIILQWHNVPDAGENWTTPPLALRTYNGRYVLERCWDDEKYSTDDSITRKKYRATYDLGSYVEDKGRFVQWRFKIRWGWLPSHSPVLEVYKDGVEVLNLNGMPNTTNDENGVVMKVGIYKWDWNQRYDHSILDRRVIYYDRILIE